jgi:hypothetical protein
MVIPIDSSCMITVFPERSLTFFTLIELLGGPPGDQLKALWYDIRFSVDYQKVDMFGSDIVSNKPDNNFFILSLVSE